MFQKTIKHLLLFALILTGEFITAATVRTSPASGSANWASISWTSTGTGTPITYVIRSGFTANMNANTTLGTGDSILISGTLTFSNSRDMTIPGATAFVQVLTGGTVGGGNSNSDLIVGATTNSGTFNIIGPAYTSNTTQFTSGNALPVTWGYVKIEQQSEKNILLWSTVSEHNNSHFEIERAGSEGAFSKIGTTDGQGTSMEINEYRFIDEKPLQGINLYRIKQVDYNGNFDYSIVVFIQNEMPSTLKVYPTLLQSSNESLHITNLRSDDRLVILDPLGREINTEIYLQSDDSAEIKIDLQPSSKGIYTVLVFNQLSQKTFKVIYQ